MKKLIIFAFLILLIGFVSSASFSSPFVNVEPKIVKKSFFGEFFGKFFFNFFNTQNSSFSVEEVVCEEGFVNFEGDCIKLNWDCSDWTECNEDRVETRRCWEEKGFLEGKPDEVKNCTKLIWGGNENSFVSDYSQDQQALLTTAYVKVDKGEEIEPENINYYRFWLEVPVAEPSGDYCPEEDAKKGYCTN